MWMAADSPPRPPLEREAEPLEVLLSVRPQVSSLQELSGPKGPPCLGCPEAACIQWPGDVGAERPDSLTPLALHSAGSPYVLGFLWGSAKGWWACTTTRKKEKSWPCPLNPSQPHYSLNGHLRFHKIPPQIRSHRDHDKNEKKQGLFIILFKDKDKVTVPLKKISKSPPPFLG